ncbi:MAG TPA: radical SAM protein [Candidatus Brocadiia bacterium]|nr:radical SAM protein [Candidatus Brocadiia bacterium]
MRFLLISPPVSNIGQAAPSISVLTSWLRGRGHECVQWELGLEIFHFFHSREYMLLLSEMMRQNAGNPETGETETVALARRLADEIEIAKHALRRSGIESELEDMSETLDAIRDCGLLISAAHGLGRLTYSRYDINGAWASWESLAESLRDPRRNILLDIMDSHVVPVIEDHMPDIVGISISYHSQLLPGFTLAILVKRALPNVKVLLGGSYLKAVQDDLKAMPTGVVPADGICIGDGETALDAYIGFLDRNGSRSDVPDMLFPEGDGFIFGAESPQFDLDAAPVPMMTADGLNLESYLVPKYAVPLPIARGCHWRRCVFCNISNQAREHYRVRSAELAVRDARECVRQFGTNWFDFPTDSWLPRDMESFARGILESGMEIEWAAEVLLRPELDAGLLRLLAESGCRCLRFGLESACTETLAAMNKQVDVELSARILAQCHEFGIKTGVMVIIGFPTETQRHLWQTVNFLEARAGDIDFLSLHQFTLAPGSRLAAEPSAAGIHLLPRRAVLTPSLPYAHSNPVATRPDDLPKIIEDITVALAEAHPQLGRLWASGVGGWMTFAAGCSNPPEFFKRRLTK